MTLKTIVNGIDVGRQRSAACAAPIRVEVTTSTEWRGGTQTRTLTATAARPGSSSEFSIDSDYPDALLGSGVAPSPNELFLTALGSSFVTSFVLAAASMGVRIEFMRVVVASAASDGSGESAEPLLGDLQLHADVEAATSPDHLEHLVAIATQRSLAGSVSRLNVQVRLNRVDRTPNQ